MSSLYTMKVELASVPKYIFALHDKLAIAVNVRPMAHGHENTRFFRVFKLADNDDTTTTTSHKFTWAEVTTLGDHALFMGSRNCKAERISTADRRGGVEGNRIYYYEERNYIHSHMARLDIGGCTVHYCEAERKHRLERIVSQGYHITSRTTQMALMVVCGSGLLTSNSSSVNTKYRTFILLCTGVFVILGE
jgi:hypothetical protein